MAGKFKAEDDHETSSSSSEEEGASGGFEEETGYKWGSWGTPKEMEEYADFIIGDYAAELEKETFTDRKKTR